MTHHISADGAREAAAIKKYQQMRWNAPGAKLSKTRMRPHAHAGLLGGLTELQRQSLALRLQDAEHFDECRCEIAPASPLAEKARQIDELLGSSIPKGGEAMVRVCSGLADGTAACGFGKNGQPCQPQKGRAKCTWCDPESLARTCESAGGRARLKQLLRSMARSFRQLALNRIPHTVYDYYFEDEFGTCNAKAPVRSPPLDEEMDSDLALSSAELDAGDFLHRASADNIEIDQSETATNSEESIRGYTEDCTSSEEECRPHKRRRSALPAPCSPEERVNPKQVCLPNRPRTAKECPGLTTEQPCIFSTTNLRQAATIHPQRGEIHCPLCSPTAFAAKESQRRPGIAPLLKKLANLDPTLSDAALQRIQDFQGPAEAEKYRKKAKLEEPLQRRPQYLQRRQLIQQPLTEAERKEYEKQLRERRRLVRRKVLCPEHKGKRGTIAQEELEVQEVISRYGNLADLRGNDAGLPGPTTETGKALEAWCKQGSWQMCEACGSMEPRRLEPVDLKKTAKPTCKRCSACRTNEYVPCLDDVPPLLRDLTPEIVQALRPLEIDVGFPERAPHGYRVHTQMICFAWAPRSIHAKIRELPKRARRQARAAHEYLVECRDSNYSLFEERHSEFLRRHGVDAELPKRRRPLRFIEEEGPSNEKSIYIYHTCIRSPAFAGLECALWPHLYWHRNLCETVARAQHEARRERKKRVSKYDQKKSEEEESEAEDADQAPVQSKLGRIKRGFIAKLLSPLIGYGADYELLQFIYDLSMWTTVGTKKNIARAHDVPLRAVLRSCPWTPQYWIIRQAALYDMQRQCGNATLFRTRAPYEKSFPYHEWIMHEQDLLGRERLHLAGAETLHHAHVLLELDKGYICGGRNVYGRSDRSWRNHLLAPIAGEEDVEEENPSEAQQSVIARVTRLEFQDGKRKRASQRYHGKGTTHSHSLEYIKHPQKIGLEHKIWAHVPNKEERPLLYGLVLDSQLDRTRSNVEVREEPSAWQADTGKLLLHHTQEDYDRHVRPYFPATMEITKCHEDIQQADGNGNVLRYVATYSMKFSDSMAQEWLNDAASDYSVARRILFSYHPSEPEMWLTLAQERFPQVDYKGTLVELPVPLPDTEPEKMPKAVKNYQEASWRREGMNLLEFCRKSNAKGEIINYIQKAHQKHVEQLLARYFKEEGLGAKQAIQDAKSCLRTYQRLKKEDAARTDSETDNASEGGGPGTPLSLSAFVLREHGLEVIGLEDYANHYAPKAEKLVAATMYSMFSDKYYGQWVLLHKPFRRVDELTQEIAGRLDKVPLHYRYFALALLAAPEMWRNDEAIREQMELEAQSKARVQSIIQKVRAQRSLIDRYLSGALTLGEDEETATEAEAAQTKEKKKPKLTQSQKQLQERLRPQVQRALQAAKTEDEEELESILEQAQHESKMLFASGPPGTGKTYVVHTEIRRWQAEGARILFVLPTGQLSSEMRAQHPGLDIDTFHGGLWFHKDISEALGIMTQYELIILDEVSMLTASQFEKVAQMWQAADRLPAVLLLGDFWQLPVVDKKARRCDESNLWRSNVKVVRFTEQVRCKDKTLQKKLDALRTAVPSVRQLRRILRRHRAWTTEVPEAWDLLLLLRRHPNTTIVTCTRRASAQVNQLATDVLFRDQHKIPLGVLPLDYEMNESNYEASGKLKSSVKLQPEMNEVYKGQRIFLTRNLDKENGFVNGMAAVIESYDPASKCLQVTTKLGKTLAIHPYTEEVDKHSNVTSFPVRLGYSTTIPKIQGSTLPHITIWLDRPGCRAAAYVAMSRVQRDDDYLIAGRVKPKHFVPAQ